MRNMMVYEMTLHLESATIALLGPHVMAEQQVVGGPAEMAEIYDDFCNTAGGSLLSTSIPAGILNIAFRFNNDHAKPLPDRTWGTRTRVRSLPQAHWVDGFPYKYP